MKTTPIMIMILAAFIWTASLPAVSGADKPSSGKPKRLNLRQLDAVPDGRYRLNLQIEDQEHSLVLDISDQSLECIESSKASLKGLRGDFTPMGNGVFRISLHNETYRASQVWIFRENGSAAVREVPDRGENQSATPITDDKKTK